MPLLRFATLTGLIALLLAAATPALAEDPEESACQSSAWCSQAARWLASHGSTEQESTQEVVDVDTPDETDSAEADYFAYPDEELEPEIEESLWDGAVWLPHRDYWPDSSAILTYDDLTREIAAFFDGSNGTIGLALYRPGDSFLAGYNLDTMLPLASVAKIEVLVAYLGLVQDEEREPTEAEHSLLEAMITYSDNYSADLLWEFLGGDAGVHSFLLSRGLTEPMASEIGTWGSSMDTPRNLALLLGQLYSGRLLNEANTALALDLLGRVAFEQRWGITAGIEDRYAFVSSAPAPEQEADAPEPEAVVRVDEPSEPEEAVHAEGLPEFWPFWSGDSGELPLEQEADAIFNPTPPATVYLKDGWYPGEEGWRINSAGIIQPADGSPAYVLVVLTDGQPGYEYGIETITTVAAMINAFMLSQGQQATATAALR